MRIERLTSVLEGEAKTSVESISCNGTFYATVLKFLKRNFGNPVTKIKVNIGTTTIESKRQNWFTTLSPTDQNQQHLPDVYWIQKSNSIVWNLVKSISTSFTLSSHSVFWSNLWFRLNRRHNKTPFIWRLDPKTSLGSIQPIGWNYTLQEAKLKQNQSSKDHFYKNRVHSNLISKDTMQNNKYKKEEPSKPEDKKEKLTCWLC